MTLPGTRTMRLANTDAEGRYGFANLPAGRYSLNVTKGGYVGLQFGQRRPFESGRPLELADGKLPNRSISRCHGAVSSWEGSSTKTVILS
jgi:hypothetical protein